MLIMIKANIKNFIVKGRRLYQLIGPLKKMLWGCIFLMLFQAAWEGVILSSMATFFQSMVDTTKFVESSFQPGSFWDKLYLFFSQIPEEKRVFAGFIVTAFSIFLKSLINVGIMTYRSKFSTLFIYQIRSTTFNNLITNSMSFFTENKKGVMISLVINETRSIYTVLKNILDLCISGMQAIVYLLFMILLSYQISIIVILSCSLFMLCNYLFSKTIKRISSVVVEKTRKMTVTADESIGGIKQIKLFNLYDQMKKSFNQACWDADFSNRKTALMIQWQATFSNLFALITLCILVFFCMKFTFMAVASFLTYLYILKSLLEIISSINQRIGLLNTNLPAMEKIVSFLEESKSYNETTGEKRKKNLLDDKIEFKNVCLDYGSGEVLKNISLEIKKSENVAFVGESGVGKTSMINLLVRLYDVNSGELLIDGVRINNYDLNFLRDKIGVVNQETILFHMTIRENIMMGRPNASEDEMITAAKNSFAHDFIMDFPRGYDSIIGDSGIKLSGGQKQRLHLSQIYLKNPELLILDEATSALDSKSENYIQLTLKKLITDRTSIIIAHRLSTIKHVDKIVVFEKGHIVEQGSWSALMNKAGKFYSMIQQQSFDK